MSTPDWLFIVGPARSGTTLLASLLDGHDDLLVWPFEWRYFTEFFNRISGDSRDVNVDKLMKEFTPIVDRFRNHSFSTYYSIIKLTGSLNYELFMKCLCDFRDCTTIQSEDFLLKTFFCYGKSVKPQKANYKYNVLKCMTKGFDWRNNDLIKRAKFIYLHRSVTKRYMSQRNKFIEKFGCNQVEVFSKCRRLFLETKIANEVYENFQGRNNFLTVELDRLKMQPDSVMKDVAAFLGIDFHPGLLNTTFLGYPFEGHFHDKNLNKGCILNVESNHTPLTEYETSLLDLFNGKQPNVFTLFKKIMRSVFYDVDRIFQHVSIQDRLKLFSTFVKYYFDIKGYFKSTLIDYSYIELKKKYPFIQ